MAKPYAVMPAHFRASPISEARCLVGTLATRLSAVPLDGDREVLVLASTPENRAALLRTGVDARTVHLDADDLTVWGGAFADSLLAVEMASDTPENRRRLASVGLLVQERTLAEVA